MSSDRRVPELDLLRAALVVGVLVFHAVHVFDPLDFYVKSDAEWDFVVPFILFAGLWGMPLLISRLRLPSARPAVLAYLRDAVLPVYVLHQTVVVVLAWRLLEWDAPAGVQLVALILGSATATLALYELLRRVPGAGLLLGQRKRSSASARTSAAAPAPSSAVT